MYTHTSIMPYNLRIFAIEQMRIDEIMKLNNIMINENDMHFHRDS